ncbi:MAG: metallophosphoesterase family protein [Planctomycetes bacterium]|nr:metallophosphoesterase family protein [Planctomycetota bacterium]
MPIALFKPALALLLLTAPALCAGHDHEGEHDPPVSKRPLRTYRPSAVPDRIVLTVTERPATSVAVTWRTDAATIQGFLEIAIAEDGPGFPAHAVSVTAETTLLEVGPEAAAYHSVVFENLQPSTKYAYRVGSGEHWSEWSHTTTASERAGDPLTFVYFGDSQNSLKSHWSRVVREAFQDAPRAAFFLHAGDLVNVGESDDEWGEWFYASGFIQRTIPVIATPGNHEYRRAKKTDPYTLTRFWRPTFTFPENGPEGLDETAYVIDYQGVRIVSLNSNEQLERQAQWLETTLTHDPQRWNVLTFHHPVYSAAKGRDNAKLRAMWQPVFERCGVDLVLTGHDHSYARTGLVTGDTNVAEGLSHKDHASGIVYVVSVSGPKQYGIEPMPMMQRMAQNTQLYQIIRIQEDTLHYQARTATGKLYDAFLLRKRAGRPNEIVELPVAMKARVPEGK